MKSKTQTMKKVVLATGLVTAALVLGHGSSTNLAVLADAGHGGHSPAGTHGDGQPAHGSSGNGHGHGSLEIPAGQPVPTVALIAHTDPVRGWNLEIQTTHFRFAPEHVNQANRPGEGHGHLYLNGEYVSRVYGHWLHLPSLPTGRNEITVSLNANGHEGLTHNGQAISSTVVVDVP